MEYKTTYDYFYNKTYALGEKMIRTTLIEAKQNSRNFLFTLELINKKNYDLIIHNCTIKSNKHLIELEKSFKNTLNTYSENQIELTLKNEVSSEFKKLNATQIPSHYTFKKFVADLGILQGINDVDFRFCDQMDYFKTKYDQNELHDLTISSISPENVLAVATAAFKQKPSKNENVEINLPIPTLSSEEKLFCFTFFAKR